MTIDRDALVEKALEHRIGYGNRCSCGALLSDGSPESVAGHVLDAILPEVQAQTLEDAAYDFAVGGWNDAFLAGNVEDDVSAVQATDAWFKERWSRLPEGGIRMSEYTPETANVRSQYASARVDHSYAGVATMASGSAEFDRWLAALKADVRKASLEEFADDYQRKYENIEPSDSEGRGYWRGARNAVEHVLAAIRAAALGDAPQKTEPTVDEFREAIHAERERQIAKGYDLQHDRAAGPGHLIPWAIDYARRGKTVEVGAMLLSLFDVLALGDAPTGGE